MPATTGPNPGPGANPPNANGLDEALEPPALDPDAEDGDNNPNARPWRDQPGDRPPADRRARAAWLTQRCDAAVARAQHIAGVQLSAAISDDNQQLLWSHAPDQAQSLASNAKLLTTAAALATLGGGFRYTTTLAVDELDLATGKVAGNVYLRGTGDPSLGYQDLIAMARELHARGVRTIAGRLVLDTAGLDDSALPPYFDSKPKERAAFRAAHGAVNVNHNAIVLVAEPTTPGKPAKVTLEPPVTETYVVPKPAVLTSLDGKTSVKLRVKTPKKRIELHAAGSVVVGSGIDRTRLRIEAPNAFAHDAMRAALRSQGIKVSAKVVVGPTPARATTLVTHRSAPLRALLIDMNKSSDNLYAEAVFRALAGTRDPTSPSNVTTWQRAAQVVRQYVTGLGVTAPWRSDNGSGLYDASAMSARQLTTVLTAVARQERYALDFWASLPVASQDGTLAKRFAQTPAADVLRAKTGTLDNVATLAGTLSHPTRPLYIAMLASGFAKKDRAAVKAVIDELASLAAAYQRAP